MLSLHHRNLSKCFRLIERVLRDIGLIYRVRHRHKDKFNRDYIVSDWRLTITVNKPLKENVKERQRLKNGQAVMNIQFDLSKKEIYNRISNKLIKLAEIDRVWSF